MKYYFAPMEGVTGAEFRRAHHQVFGGVDAAIKLMVHSITSVITSQLYAFPHDSLRSLMHRLDAALTHEAFESLL